MEGYCFLNGEWLDLKQATVPIGDLGIVRGCGVFDYLRTYQGRPFHLWDHLIRLRKSAKILNLSLPYSFEEIEAMIEELLKKTAYPETSFKILLTGGLSSDQFHFEEKPTFCVMAYPYQKWPMEQYERGIAVVTTEVLRPLPQAKSTSYLAAFTLPKGVLDALYVNGQGEVLEGLTSNIFVVKKGRLITPISNAILPGVTREVLRRCALPDIPLDTISLPLAEIKEWDEVFLTSSSREIMPVIAIGDQLIGEGKVGPWTRELMRRFHTYTHSLTWTPLWKEEPTLVNS